MIEGDISSANTIIGVKEIPTNLLLPNKTYMFFSHTIKAQLGNMHMLDDILAKNIRLIDYERIVDSTGKRLVKFGKFAGICGFVDSLQAFGERLLSLGYNTPFLHTGYAYMYDSIEDCKKKLKLVAEEIKRDGFPNKLLPMTFVFTGGYDGACTSGALEMFELLPHKKVTYNELVALHQDTTKVDNKVVYVMVTSSEDRVEPKEKDKQFNKKEFYEHPERYTSTFASKFLPYTSFLINGAYWKQNLPRVITIHEIKEYTVSGKNRLLGIADVSCDLHGGIEFTKKCGVINKPTFIYNPKHDTIVDGIEGEGILVGAVDNWPCELARESSKYFGDNLFPFIEGLIKSNATLPYEKQTDLPTELHQAVIASHGSLTPNYQYIMTLRSEREKKNGIL